MGSMRRFSIPTVMLAALGCSTSPNVEGETTWDAEGVISADAFADAGPGTPEPVDRGRADGALSDAEMDHSAPKDAGPDAQDHGSDGRDARLERPDGAGPDAAGAAVDSGADGASSLADAADVGVDGAPQPLAPRFHEVRFAATHNSYSGEARRALRAQLDEGVRVLELDVHDDDYAAVGDYRVGHLFPGDAVDHADQNPGDDRLGSWLAVVARWSVETPGHGPTTIILDLKDSVADNDGPAAGNLGALNGQLEALFGARLLEARGTPPPWPRVQALRDRVLVVLSGDEGSRAAYGRDHGSDPAVAVNAHGQVIEVHESGRRDLWYWTGQMRGDGHIEWHHHARYDAGQRPAVALTDDGHIIEVHQGAVRPTLLATVGRLGPDLRVQWGPPRQYDTGVAPSLRLRDQTTVHEIHRSEGTGAHWAWTARLRDGGLSFADHGRTDAALYPVDQSGEVRVFTAADAQGTPDTLQYATAAVAQDRIRYRQLAFVEAQPGDGDPLTEGARFRAAPAGQGAFVDRPGVVSRWWGFTEAHVGADFTPQMPATDTPFAPWYRALVADAVR